MPQHILRFSRARCFHEFGTFLQNVELISRSEVIFMFVPHEYNGVAHDLAHHTFLSSISKN